MNAEGRANQVFDEVELAYHLIDMYEDLKVFPEVIVVYIGES